MCVNTDRAAITATTAAAASGTRDCGFHDNLGMYSDFV